MESSFQGFVLDPSKCSKLSMDEKRELVYEISKSHGAPEMLLSWSRQELMQILCAELGREKKYGNLSKFKLIEYLLKVVSKKTKSFKNGTVSESQSPQVNAQNSCKRQRKTDHPSRLTIEESHFHCKNDSECTDNVIYCQNSACRATIRPEDAFCKRCSCCICFRYDDNKDPSLWLFCNSEPPNQGPSCGMSCHIECALKHEKTGISEGGYHSKLDVSFYCISCGKVNDLIGFLLKQLTIAKFARRVDVLCNRVFICHKLLQKTEKYQEHFEIVDKIVKKLEAEVGTLDGLPIKMARGIVNRLSSGAEIQKLCSSAVDLLDVIVSTVSQPASATQVQEMGSVSSKMVSVIDVSATTITIALSKDVGFVEELASCTLWHRKSATTDYPVEPTCTFSRPFGSFLVSNLAPATDYTLKVIFFSNSRELGKCEVCFRTIGVSDHVPKAAEEGLKEAPCVSPKRNCSGLSNPFSEGDDSNSPGNCSSYCVKTSMPRTECGYTHKERSHTQNIDTDVIARNDATEQEEMLGDSVSALDEEHATGEDASGPNSVIATESQRDSTNSANENQASDIPKSEKKNHSTVPLLDESSFDTERNTSGNGNKEIVPIRCGTSNPPITPCKLEADGLGWSVRAKSPRKELPEKWPPRPEEPQAGSSSKKRKGGRFENVWNGDGSLESGYEYCVKVIRSLECEGHIQKSFRVKFLTWFSLYATLQEQRIVSVYVDTLIDDPASLAGQLVDTFSESICRKRPPPVPTGFCMKLWH